MSYIRQLFFGRKINNLAISFRIVDGELPYRKILLRCSTDDFRNVER